jgi:hypothetical protein
MALLVFTYGAEQSSSRKIKTKGQRVAEPTKGLALLQKGHGEKEAKQNCRKHKLDTFDVLLL